MVAHSEAALTPSVSPGTRYCDGRSAAAHAATLRWSDAFLSIDGIAGELAVWPRARLMVGEPDPDGRVTLACKGAPGRLTTDVSALPARITAPRMQRTTRSRATRKARLAHAAGIAQPVRLVVIDSKTLNALTLPGAHMVIMRGLLDQVGNADQLAGVMAHETGHIARRDPLVALFDSAGLGVISATLGINLGFANLSSLAGRLVGLSYSREMERLADANGVAYLQASGLCSDGLVAFFALTGKRGDSAGSGEALEFLSDHPRTSEREKDNQGSPLGESALTA
jgi:Zn-dependent protease with chaperone function